MSGVEDRTGLCGEIVPEAGKLVAGRFGVDAESVAALRELDLLYDRSPDGEFIHFYTRTVGSVFFEFVERRGQYDGYGSDNAPVRLAAQRAGRFSSR